MNVKKIVDRFFEFFNLKIIKKQSYDSLIKEASFGIHDRDFIVSVCDEANWKGILDCIPYSKSQLRQDIFVLSVLGFKKSGYFVEFGATDGVHLSNTNILEKKYFWKGILAEPAILWHEQLRNNRDCHIETSCVWSVSGENLMFNEAEEGELSTIGQYLEADSHSEARKDSKEYMVETISLNDLLAKYQAPRDIDYLSIDTEGSEYEILRNFDFDTYNIKVITCEHNYSPIREKIFDLLIANGYERVYENISKFDDWYVKATY